MTTDQIPNTASPFAPLETRLLDAALRHAIDNGGALRSPRQAQPLAGQFAALVRQTLANGAVAGELADHAQAWIRDGLALETAVAFAEEVEAFIWSPDGAIAVPDDTSTARRLLAAFSRQFLHHIATARERHFQETQEATQLAMHHALHTQLERQRELRQQQERSGRNLRQILRLMADLARLGDVDEMLIGAVRGLAERLTLSEVTVYAYRSGDEEWTLRAATQVDWTRNAGAPVETAALLNEALNNETEIIAFTDSPDESTAVQVAAILRIGPKVLGGLVVDCRDDLAVSQLPVLVTTFALSLASLWQNLRLLEETRGRARELEILHGRYVDSIWYTRQAALTARFADGHVDVERGLPAPEELTPGIDIPLVIGQQPLGIVSLPPDITISDEDASFVQALLRETGNALNNARLLQVTRAYSNQLHAASEVSRAASTMLDQSHLMQEVVERIRNRFDFYYVGLYLIDNDSKEVVLKAGSGESGQTLTRMGFSLPLGGRSMVGSVAASGELRVSGDVAREEIFYRNELLPETASELAIPLIVGDQPLGVLTVQSRILDAFSDEDVIVFQTLADQLATAIQNASLFDRLQRNLDETGQLYEASQRLTATTEALYRVSSALNQAITREDAISTVVEEVASQTGLTQCRFVLFEQRTGIGQVIVDGPTATPAPEARFTQGPDSVYAALQREPQPLLLSPDDLQPEAVEYTRQIGDANVLIIPAASQQEILGFLALEGYDPRHPLDGDRLNFIRSAVDQLTTTLESLKLFADTLRSAQELVILNQIGSRISGTLDLNRLAGIVYHEVGRLVDNTIFILALYDDETRYYEPLLAMNQGEEVAETPRHLTTTSPLYRCLLDGRPILTAESEAFPTVAGTMRDSDGRLPASCLWMPMLQETRPIGLLSVQSYAPHAYTDNDIQLLRTIATQTGLAVSNARLFGETEANVAKLQEVDRLKTQFLANMSHELRTPLNSIIGFSRIMLKGIDGPITELQEEDLESIHSSGQHLLKLINEILDLAKIEAGRMTLVFETVAPAAMLADLQAVARGLIQERSDTVTLEWEVADPLPLIEADPIRLRQILLNLLSNAVKFTENGNIRLTAAPDDRDHIYFSVSDSGPGIAPEDYDKLFKAFQQVDASPTRARGGTGLGLSITQRLVHLHGGQIWFESELGQGTTFHVLLPFRQSAGALRSGTSPLRISPAPTISSGDNNGQTPPRQNPSILVVDDELDTLALYKRYLRDTRYQLVTAASAQDALKLLKDSDRQFDLILLDINMPDVDGWTLLDILRDDKRTVGIPVVICSIENDPVKTAERGAQLLLPKPVEKANLQQVLDAVFGR